MTKNFLNFWLKNMTYKNSLNKYQLDFLNHLKKYDNIKDNFFLSWWTCITAFYYPYRYSYDLDFFTFKDIDYSFVFKLISDYEIKNNVKKINYVKLHSRRIFNIFYKDNFELKVEFTDYFKPLYDLNFSKEFQIHYLTEQDLIIDKLFVLHERKEVKDFFDFVILYKNMYNKAKEYNLNEILYKIHKKFWINLHKNLFCKIFYEWSKLDYSTIILLKKDIDVWFIKDFYLEFLQNIDCL